MPNKPLSVRVLRLEICIQISFNPPNLPLVFASGCAINIDGHFLLLNSRYAESRRQEILHLHNLGEAS